MSELQCTRHTPEGHAEDAPGFRIDAMQMTKRPRHLAASLDKIS